MSEWLTGMWMAHPVPASAVAVVVVVVVVWGLVALLRGLVTALRDRRVTSAGQSGAPLFYVVAAMSTAVSANTSWRFFEHELHITAVAERVAMFAVLEAAFIACAYAMRANVRQPGGQPGAPRTVAWTLTLLAAYMAVAESDLWEGIARVALGPVLGIVALHLALGVEIRRASPERASSWAQLVREARERTLSRFGLANDDRDAATRTRHRAALRAARLATAERGWFRMRRLARAVRVAGVAHDPDTRARMLAELAALKSLDDLVGLTPPSPWAPTPAPEPAGTQPVLVDSGTRPGETDEAPTVELPALQSEGVQPSNGHATSEQLHAVQPPSVQRAGVHREQLARTGKPVRCGVQSAGSSAVRSVAGREATSPARDRADKAASNYLAQHSELPTVTRLAELAEVSRGTAGEALKALRNTPTPLHLVSKHDHQEAHS